MAEGLEQVAALADPIGEISELRRRPSGIEVGRMRVPLGVVGIIYESRPNVTVDAAGLTIKSGNAAILRGGSEAIRCNRALAALIHEGLAHAGLPADVVQVIDSTDRAAVAAMITMPQYIDVIVPRGGKGLIERLMRESRVPMIKHLDGLCHVYVDDAADLEQARAHRRQREDAALRHLQHDGDAARRARRRRARSCRASARIYAAKAVEMRADDESRAILADAGIAADRRRDRATSTPSGSRRSSRSRSSTASTRRSTTSTRTARSTPTRSSPSASDRALRFLREVDSASVMVNASTRFADGFEFGLGAEIGISNDKLHARGPVGLEGLTSLKYVVFGHGETRG